MYNEELKTKFINYHTTSDRTRGNCVALFNALEDFEVEQGADICTIKADLLLPALNDVMGVKSRSATTRHSILKEYAKYCINNNVDGACDALLNIVCNTYEKLKTRTVPSPKGLQAYLDTVFDKESEQTIDNLYRCYFWLAFGGMIEDDIFEVTNNDIDFRRMVVRYDKRNTVIPIYTEALDAFYNCVELEKFRHKHSCYSEDKQMQYRIDGNLLLRGIKKDLNKSTTKAEISKRTSKNDVKLSYLRAWMSGVFYRMWEAELLGKPVDFFYIAGERMENREYKLDSGRNTLVAKQKQLARDYLEDYRRWKMAWRL